MSTWALCVAGYLLLGIAITEIGYRQMFRNNNPMMWQVYIIGFILWPLIMAMAIRSIINKRRR